VKVKIQKLDGGKASGDVELNDAVFGVEPRADILHHAVRIVHTAFGLDGGLLQRPPRPQRGCHAPP